MKSYIKFGKQALDAIELIKGDRTETISETVSRSLGIAELIAIEQNNGAKIYFQQMDGSIKWFQQ